MNRLKRARWILILMPKRKHHYRPVNSPFNMIWLVQLFQPFVLSLQHLFWCLVIFFSSQSFNRPFIHLFIRIWIYHKMILLFRHYLNSFIHLFFYPYPFIHFVHSLNLIGYKRRRISFCFTGLTSTAILSYMVLMSEAKFSLHINILISMSIGLFVSLFTTTLLYCGLFITGLFAGFVNGFIFLMIYTSFATMNSVALASTIIAVFGLVQVFVTMWWKHRMHILSSCVFAAAVMVSSLDYFVEGFFMLEYMEMKIFYDRVAKLCWWSYLMFALFGLFLVIGLLVQCLWSGKEKQKEPYTFVYLTRRRQARNREQRSSNPYGDEHYYLINNSWSHYWRVVWWCCVVMKCCIFLHIWSVSCWAIFQYRIFVKSETAFFEWI